MTLKDFIFTLNHGETLRLMGTLLDEDKKEALLFVKECLKPQLDQATWSH